jgi:hypothetical protein
LVLKFEQICIFVFEMYCRRSKLNALR